MTQEWLQRPEGGHPLMLQSIRLFAQYCGRAPARLLLYPITAYFLLRRGPERRASRQYLSRVLGRPATLRDVARHICWFAAATLDRVFLLSERFKRFRIETSGLRELDRALKRGRGVLLIGSHLGSFEALRALSLERPDVAVRVVLDVEQAPALSTILNALNPAMAATIINARNGGPAVAMAIKEALERNAIVALLADRARPGNATLPASFLGRPAPFPTGPWLLAAMLKVPVFLAFGLYAGGNRYHLHFESFVDDPVIERHERQRVLAQLVQRFADRLAHYARTAPYNWFNFYDFWQDAPSTPAADGRAAPDGGLVRRS